MDNEHKKKLYGLELHESMTFGSKVNIAGTITRVPGGWIYAIYTISIIKVIGSGLSEGNMAIRDKYPTSTFVPFDNQFEPK